jgi:glucose/mannose transport system substrate-binding protein
MRWPQAAALLATFLVGPAFLPAALSAEGLGVKDLDPLSVYHWLESPSEVAALKELVDLFKIKYPDVVVKPVGAPRRGSVALLPIIEARVKAGNPPDSVMMHVGYSAQVFFDGGMLAPVDDIWTSEKLEKVMPDVLRSMCKFDGHYYAVPLNVHRGNLVWYNKALLQQHGIDAATLTTWPAFFDAAKKLRAAGVKAPLSMGVEWTAQYVFECILASQGLANYEDWVNGKVKTKDDPRLIDALSTFKQYLLFVNDDHTTIEWDGAVKRVVKGQSAFFLMGDWANGEFQLAGLKYGKEYGAIPVPGTKGLFSLTIDAFVRPNRITDQSRSDAWLKLVSSREGQEAFSIAKGSIPARIDPVAAKYDAYQQSSIADLKTAKGIPSLSAAVPVAYKVRVDRILSPFIIDGDAAKAAAAIANAPVEMADKFTRTWSFK